MSSSPGPWPLPAVAGRAALWGELAQGCCWVPWLRLEFRVGAELLKVEGQILNALLLALSHVTTGGWRKPLNWPI